MRKLTAPWCAWRSGAPPSSSARSDTSAARLVLVVPERLEVGRVGLERRTGGLDRQREDALGEPQPRLAGERDIGHEGGRARRAVDERHALLGLEVEAGAEVVEQAAERDDLPGAAVALARDLGQRRVEHRDDLARGVRAHRGVPVDEVGQPREHDPAHDAVGERLAEGMGRPQPGRPARRRLGRQRDRGAVAGSRRGAVDQRARVGRDAGLDERHEARVRVVHPRERLGRERDALALPGHPPDRVEGDVGAGGERKGHTCDGSARPRRARARRCGGSRPRRPPPARAAAPVLLRADPAQALEGRAQRERAAVADALGDRADRRVRLEQQVGGERDAASSVRNAIGGSPTRSVKRRASAARDAPVSGASSATVQGGPGCCAAAAARGRRPGRRRRGTSSGAPSSGRANHARSTAISSRSSSRSSTASCPGSSLTISSASSGTTRAVSTRPRAARAAAAAPRSSRAADLAVERVGAGEHHGRAVGGVAPGAHADARIVSSSSCAVGRARSAWPGWITTCGAVAGSSATV